MKEVKPSTLFLNCSWLFPFLFVVQLNPHLLVIAQGEVGKETDQVH